MKVYFILFFASHGGTKEQEKKCIRKLPVTRNLLKNSLLAVSFPAQNSDKYAKIILFSAVKYGVLYKRYY